MIHIKQNQLNTVVLTLNELATTATYSVLFEFTNDQTGLVKQFSSTDLSMATDRYNKFLITETANENLIIGSVSLASVGYWSYNVYQMPTPINLSDTPIKVLESGKVLVTGATQSITVFTVNDTKNNVIFE